MGVRRRLCPSPPREGIAIGCWVTTPHSSPHPAPITPSLKLPLLLHNLPEGDEHSPESSGLMPSNGAINRSVWSTTPSTFGDLLWPNPHSLSFWDGLWPLTQHLTKQPKKKKKKPISNFFFFTIYSKANKQMKKKTNQR